MCTRYTNIAVSGIGSTLRRRTFPRRASRRPTPQGTGEQAAALVPLAGVSGRVPEGIPLNSQKRPNLARFGVRACNSSTLGQKSRKTPKNRQNGHNTGTAQNSNNSNGLTRAHVEASTIATISRRTPQEPGRGIASTTGRPIENAPNA